MLWWPNEIPELAYGRVLLRRPHQGDVEAVYKGCRDSEVPRFTTIPDDYTILHAQDYVDRVQTSIDIQRELPFVIEFDGTFAGTISLHSINQRNNFAEIGYWIDKDIRGKGVGTTAVKVITNYAIQTIGFKRIEALVDSENIYSQKLLLSAGYAKEGLLRERSTKDSGLQVDMVMLAATSSTWTGLEP
jgi:RimJ/RimL family protein N-acetyltransferase